MRVLVCGGRRFSDYASVDLVLSHLHATKGIAVIIHGCARGADMLAERWALGAGVQCERYQPDWTLGRKAGPIRNRRMLTEGKPDLVVVFPGGTGTTDMVRAAQVAGVPVMPRAAAMRAITGTYHA